MKAWVYLRGEEQQLDKYRSILHNLARQKGFEIVGESRDEGSVISNHRPGFKEVFAAHPKHGFTTLLAVDSQQLAKDHGDAIKVKRLLDEIGVEIELADGFFVTLSPLQSAIQQSCVQLAGKEKQASR